MHKLSQYSQKRHCTLLGLNVISQDKVAHNTVFSKINIYFFYFTSI